MLRILFVVASSLALATALQFTDCATDPSNTALTVHSLDISPAVIVFPGQIRISTNITVNQRITHLFIDTVLEKNTLGAWTKIPCIGSTNIGSCQNIDSCTILDNILNGSSVVSQDFGQQIDAILLKALGHKASCPISPESVVINNESLTLQALPSTLSLISQGKYRVTISVKDDPTNPDNLGCIQFQAEIARHVDPNQVG
ncbi:uncharacterized protein LOC132732306 [Ruditapes philippinarum]|uniref:uncharacterized protein LOC132732306 n=1 Tax=Ruditapes philippinarum TaxID=129788 RepID=UPI00295B85B1|nr:uncharacterized protein LOC132732306 [Ruditapes philippinarum]